VIRTFLDANVLFRAAKAARSHENASWGVIELAGTRDDLTVMTTGYAFDEAESKLREKSPTALGEYVSLKPMLETCPEPPDALAHHLRRLIQDEKDRPILAGAIFAKADWLLTWDYKHFGHLYGIRVYDVLITTPSQGLHRFRQLT
jgi:predicted nucleic acid-binding protein